MRLRGQFKGKMESGTRTSAHLQINSISAGGCVQGVTVKSIANLGQGAVSALWAGALRVRRPSGRSAGHLEGRGIAAEMAVWKTAAESDIFGSSTSRKTVRPRVRARSLFQTQDFSLAALA